VSRSSLLALLVVLTTCRHVVPEAATRVASPGIAGELGATRLCDELRGRFLGTLWIRDCTLALEQGRFVFQLDGSAWRGADRSSVHAGFIGTPAVRYDRDQHATIQLIPIRPPTIDLARSQDASRLRVAVAETVMTTLSRERAVAVHDRGVGDRIRSASFEASAGDLVIEGPFDVPARSDVELEARGPVRVAVVCEHHARAQADAFLAGRPATEIQLASVDLLPTPERAAHARLRLARTQCPIVLIARALDSGPAQMTWRIDGDADGEVP
jgi:hypothetical protein